MTLRAAAGLSIALGLMSTELVAQSRRPQVVTTIDSVRADGSIKKVPLKTADAFELFAVADLAGGFIRSSGTLTGGITNEGGPASVNQGAAIVQEHIANNAFYVFFEMGFVAGASPSAYKKFKACIRV